MAEEKSENSVSSEQKESQSQSEKKKNVLQGFFDSVELHIFEPSLENLFKAGAHFGHKRSRRNPRMDEFIYAFREGVGIIDLKKTMDKLEEAINFIRTLSQQQKSILFVGTKKHAAPLVRSAAKRTGNPYVVERWLGGTFTNFDVIRKRIAHMKEVEQKLEGGEFQEYTKFERLKKAEEVEKLDHRMGGLRDMDELPGAIFVVDIKHDQLAIREAQSKNVPVIALVDTNDDPTSVDYPIPANNDALSSLKYLLGVVCKTIEEGKVQPAAQAEDEKEKAPQA